MTTITLVVLGIPKCLRVVDGCCNSHESLGSHHHHTYVSADADAACSVVVVAGATVAAAAAAAARANVLCRVGTAGRFGPGSALIQPAVTQKSYTATVASALTLRSSLPISVLRTRPDRIAAPTIACLMCTYCDGRSRKCSQSLRSSSESASTPGAPVNWKLDSSASAASNGPRADVPTKCGSTPTDP